MGRPGLRLAVRRTIPRSTRELARHLGAFDACIAYTGQDLLVSRLGRSIPRVISRSPVPIGVHAAQWLSEPTRALGALPPLVPPDLQPTASEEAEAAAFLRGRLAPGFLALHAGSGGPGEELVERPFRESHPGARGKDLAARRGPGGRSRLPRSGRPRASCVRAHGLPLRVLGAVLRRAGLFVGNDSGVTHLAAAYGAPTLALFGPTDPGSVVAGGPARRRVPDRPRARCETSRSPSCGRPLVRSGTTTPAPGSGERRAHLEPADQSVDADRHPTARASAPARSARGATRPRWVEPGASRRRAG